MNASADPVELVLEKLRALGSRLQRDGQGFAAQCPAHADAHPSLGVHRGRQGDALLCCRAGCSIDSVLSALGMSFMDLKADGNRQQPSASKANADQGQPRGFDTASAAAEQLRNQFGAWSQLSKYLDADGTPAGIVLRWDSKGSDGKSRKEVRPVWRTDSRWRAKWPSHSRPLYLLQKLKHWTRVFVAEGEKCADALDAMGLCATTSSGGAMQACKSSWEPLKGREVIVLPDADAPGMKYARDVVALLEAQGTHARIVELPGLQRDSGADIVDWLKEQHRGDKEAAFDALQALADVAFGQYGAGALSVTTAHSTEEGDQHAHTALPSDSAGAPDILLNSVSLTSLLDDPNALAPPLTLPSGFEGFDAASPFGAVALGAKVLWGGDPGTGKSRWLLALALGYARNGSRVVYALGEMSPRAMFRRALLMEAGLGNAALLNAEPHQVKLQAAAAALRTFANELCFIQHPIDFSAIGRAAEWADVLILDPVQAVRSAKAYEQRHEELDALMHCIVELSVKHHTVFHMASEIGKQEGAAARTLQSAFKGSSALAQYADAAYLLKPAVCGFQEVECLKQRDGDPLPFRLQIAPTGLKLFAPHALEALP